MAAEAVAVAAVAAAEAAVKSLPRLGTGLGYRRNLHAEIFAHRDRIDCLELVADHFFDESRVRRRELDLLAASFPLVVHGLDLSLGSADGFDRDYLRRIARVVKRANAVWWSEHIAFTKAGSIRFGHLAPLPFSREAVDVVCRNVLEVRRSLELPLFLENISSAFELPGAEMDEASFISNIIERTGSGLLLDVTNLHTNATNRGFLASGYLASLPASTPVQLHFAGGHFENGELLDSHAHATAEPVWQLMAAILQRFDVRAMILERDENLPPIGELLAELERARSLEGSVVWSS